MSALPLSSTNAALLVIDVQESFRQMPYWSAADLPTFQDALQRLISGCRQRGVPVLNIFHVAPEGPFSVESGLLRPLDGFSWVADATVHKHTHNAFTDSGLDLFLRRRGIGRVVIAGIRCEQCCETTARVAADIGYAVDFVSEATLTFAMRHPSNGRCYSPAAIREHTELVLADRFARIVDVDGCLASLGESDA
ncbi:MAG TPA: isochorismatase family protein [Accumulibacter sp.]|nr:isochorismatase family protein [Accumulibacter sp.]HPP46434.1 isochorismatase family protein [Accumulibacter sp.]